MTGVVLRRWPLRTVSPSGVLLSSSLAVWLLSHHWLPSVHRCVAPDAHLAWLGVHLDVLHNDPACGSGGYALGADHGYPTGIVLMVAVPALLANLATVLSAAGVWAALRGVLVRAATLVGQLWPRLVRDPAAANTCGAAPTAWAPGGLARAWQLERSPVRRRGPPAPRVA
jgi:hypothetical protein